MHSFSRKPPTDLKKFIASLSNDELKKVILRNMCNFMRVQSLNPKEHGFWYSRRKFLLFSLKKIYERAELIQQEMDLPLNTVKVEIKGNESKVYFHYPYQSEIYTETHLISDYKVYEESLTQFLKRY